MPVLLAIETSQRIGGVAVCDLASPGEIHAEMLSVIKRHDDDLLPAIDRLFARCGFTPGDLGRGGAVAVSIGPGGFTGLRIAIATAKMFAETLVARLLAVPSALVAAESIAEPRSEMVVTLACKGESCWATRLTRTDSEWRVVGTPANVHAETLLLEGIEALIGDQHLPPAIRQKCYVSNLPIIEPVFDPRACLTVALRMMARGQITDPLLLTPLYSREPEAVTLWEKKLKT